ncbi:hypothetical protein E7T06_16065 [Deinococcus sp. Arct2-2]|uniref:hypothetical protein n=1 Tax=Deinococcus sp. Arct2-2 TaxID=2568653 RepID=UPI0010A3CB26|nr:hypothetical protein [Deinococcus sp. Arct2-2]THF68530.1 hypothetical protein E7T06_16065 [Deinococcus sp. Arct2-2]
MKKLLISLVLAAPFISGGQNNSLASASYVENPSLFTAIATFEEARMIDCPPQNVVGSFERICFMIPNVIDDQVRAKLESQFKKQLAYPWVAAGGVAGGPVAGGPKIFLNAWLTGSRRYPIQLSTAASGADAILVLGLLGSAGGR